MAFKELFPLHFKLSAATSSHSLSFRSSVNLGFCVEFSYISIVKYIIVHDPIEESLHSIIPSKDFTLKMKNPRGRKTQLFYITKRNKTNQSV